MMRTASSRLPCGSLPVLGQRIRSAAVLAAFLVVAGPALADDAAILKRLDDMQRMMELQQQQIAAQRGEIAALRGALRRKGVVAPPAPTTTAEAAPPPPPPKSVEAHFAPQQV